MSPPLLQAKGFAKPLLLGCVIAWSLPMVIFGEDQMRTNDAIRLKPHQAVSTNPPPAAPEIFNPDPNPPQLPEPPPTRSSPRRSPRPAPPRF